MLCGIHVCVIYFQAWMQLQLDKAKTNFFGYLAKMQHSVHLVDGILIVMFAQMISLNIGLVHRKGVWSSDPTQPHNLVLVYKGSSQFASTDKGKNLNFSLLETIWHVKKPQKAYHFFQTMICINPNVCRNNVHGTTMFLCICLQHF